jgi:hypothetical protein
MEPLAKDPGWTLSARRGDFGARGGDLDDRRPNANVEDSLRGIVRSRGQKPVEHQARRKRHGEENGGHHRPH